MRVAAICFVSGLLACRAAPSPGGATETAPSSSEGTGTTSDDDETDASTATTRAVPFPDLPPPPVKLCSLEVIDPLADPSAVIQMGDGRGQIPTAIGEALLRNCGCHYTDNVVGYVDYKSNKVAMATLADFHAPFAGTLPQGFRGRPTYEAMHERIVNKVPAPMPPLGCTVEGEPGMITAADVELFARWLTADAPDGATFR